MCLSCLRAVLFLVLRIAWLWEVWNAWHFLPIKTAGNADYRTTIIYWRRITIRGKLHLPTGHRWCGMISHYSYVKFCDSEQRLQPWSRAVRWFLHTANFIGFLFALANCCSNDWHEVENGDLFWLWNSDAVSGSMMCKSLPDWPVGGYKLQMALYRITKLKPSLSLSAYQRTAAIIFTATVLH